MAVTLVANAATLGLTVLTGVLTARLLEPDGRGEVAAIVAWASVVALVASLGSKEAVTYVQARRPEEAPEILTTFMLWVAGLAVVGVAISELLLPLGFASQSQEVVQLARVFLLMTIPWMVWEGLVGVLNGHQFFVVASCVRVAQLTIMGGALVVLWQLDRVTVTTVLATHVISHVSILAFLLLFLARRVGFGGFSPDIARSILHFGSRSHLGTLGSVGNARLDVFVMPMILAPREIGLYAVAVSGASIIIPLFGELRAVLFAVASRRGDIGGMPLVETTLRFSLAGALIVAAILALAAPWLVSALYGPDFAGSVTALRLLLPGMVFWAGVSILAGGINATGKPVRSSKAQLIGLAVTVIGLAVTLPTVGIVGAAITSTVAYTIVFLVLLRYISSEPAFSTVRAFALGRLVQDTRSLLQWAIGGRHRRAPANSDR